MNNSRLASLCFVAALVSAPLPASAQRPSNNPKALDARVTALEAAVAALQSGQTTLQNNINAEAGARAAADATLQTNINTEAASGAAADTALGGRVDKLEGNIVAADLVGTYALYLVAISMDPPGTVATYNEMSSYVIRGTATLNADGSGSINATAFFRVMTEQTANLNWTNEGGSAPGVTSLNWTYSNGTLSITNATGFNDFDLSVAAGGQVLVSANGGPPSNNQQLTVWTRK